MQRGLTGHFVPVSSPGETCRAFVPNPLPPDPPLTMDAELQSLHEQATLALGRLDGLTAVLPDPSLFLYYYRATLSSCRPRPSACSTARGLWRNSCTTTLCVCLCWSKRVWRASSSRP